MADPVILGANSWSGINGTVTFDDDVPAGGTLHLIFAALIDEADTGDFVYTSSCSDDGGPSGHIWVIEDLGSDPPLIGAAAVDGSFIDPINFQALQVWSAARFCGGAANECKIGDTVTVTLLTNTLGALDIDAMIVYIPAQFFVPIGQDGGGPSEYGNGDGYTPGAPYGSPTPGEIDWSADPFVAPAPYANEDAFVIAAVASEPATGGWSPTEFTAIGNSGRISASYLLATGLVQFNPGGSGGGSDFVVGNYQTSKEQSGPNPPPPGEAGFSISNRFSP